MALKDWEKTSMKNVWKNNKTREYIQIEKTYNIKKYKDMWRLISQQNGYGTVRNISWHNSYKSALSNAKRYKNKN